MNVLIGGGGGEGGGQGRGGGVVVIYYCSGCFAALCVTKPDIPAFAMVIVFLHIYVSY